MYLLKQYGLKFAIYQALKYIKSLNKFYGHIFIQEGLPSNEILNIKFAEIEHDES